ncbi:hypothetical protein EMIT0347P_200006 [Pseudomonas sp. IT-347P]
MNRAAVFLRFDSKAFLLHATNDHSSDTTQHLSDLTGVQLRQYGFNHSITRYGVHAMFAIQPALSSPPSFDEFDCHPIPAPSSRGLA